MRKERIIIGKHGTAPATVKTEGDKIVWADRSSFSWAIGKTRRQLVDWLIKKRIPWRCCGWRDRKSDAAQP